MSRSNPLQRRSALSRAIYLSRTLTLPPPHRVAGAVCFFEWGLIHILAFVMMGPAGLRNDMVGYYKELVGLAPQADKDEFANCKFPKWTGRPLFQHAWNLGWAGAFSWLCIWLIFEPNSLLPVISLVPWLADVGYFMAIVRRPRIERETFTDRSLIAARCPRPAALS